MRRQKLRGTSARLLLESPKKLRQAARVDSRAQEELDASTIRFALLIAIVGKRAEPSGNATDSIQVGAAPEQPKDQTPSQLSQNSLGSVAKERMLYLVSENPSDLFPSRGSLQQSTVNRHEATGKGKGVDRRILLDHEREGKRLFR